MWLKCVYITIVTRCCDHLQHLRQIFPNQRLVRPGQAEAAQVFPENKVAAAQSSHLSLCHLSLIRAWLLCSSFRLLSLLRVSGPPARVSDVRELRGSHATILVTFSAGMIEKKVF